MGKILQIDKKSFRNWLQYARPITVSNNPVMCPLATYLRKSGHKDVLVSSNTFVRIDDATYRLPFWASRFVARVDSYGVGTTIFAETAIAALSFWRWHFGKNGLLQK